MRPPRELVFTLCMVGLPVPQQRVRQFFVSAREGRKNWENVLMLKVPEKRFVQMANPVIILRFS